MFGILANEAFQQAEFEMAGREWRISKMQAIPAYKLFMQHFRPCLGAIKGVDFPEAKEGMSDAEMRSFGEKQMGAMIEVFANIPYQNLDEIWKEFARHCIWTKNDGGQWARLAMDPEAYTENLDPAHILILVARAAARNFGESLAKAAAELGLATMPMTETESSQKSPTHSSTQESEPDTSHSLI